MILWTIGSSLADFLRNILAISGIAFSPQLDTAGGKDNETDPTIPLKGNVKFHLYKDGQDLPKSISLNFYLVSLKKYGRYIEKIRKTTFQFVKKAIWCKTSIKEIRSFLRT